MLERYFVKPATIDRIRANWLAPEIERYVEWLDSHGYAARNVFRRVPILCRFAEYAEQHGAASLLYATSLIEGFAAHWLAAHEPQRGSAQARRKIAEDARNPVRQMLRLALEGRVTAVRQHKPFPFAAEVPGFLRYLREERGLRETAIYHYIHRLHRFGDYLRRVGVTSLVSRLLHCAPSQRT